MRLPGKYMNGFICIIFYLTHLSSLRAKEQDISAYPHFTHKKSTMTSALSHCQTNTIILEAFCKYWPLPFVGPLFRTTLWLSSGAQHFPAAFQSKRIG